MNATPQYSALSDGEKKWIAAHLEYGRSIGLNPVDARAIGEFFDSSLRAIEHGEQSPEDANAVINIVAVLLGEHICTSSKLRWAIITDELGSDLCVHDPATSWVFFPQSSVAKRWEAKELGWVQPFVAWAKQSVSAPPR